MRLSTVQIFQQNINAILDMQTKVAELDLKIATGKRILKPSDDPAGSVRVMNISSAIKATEQYTRNIDAARNQISEEESILGQQGATLQRIRELVVQANSDTLNANNRKAIATEIDSLRDQMLSLANSKDAFGEFIFAGYQVTNQPFTQVSGSIQYNGDQGQRFVQIGSRTQVATRDSGYDVFLNIRTGNGVFTARANPENTGSAVITSSIAGTFEPDDYTILFTQASAGAPIIYEVRDGSGALLQTDNYKPGESIAFNGAQASFTGEPVNGDSFTVATSRSQDIFTTLQNTVDTLSTGIASGILHNNLNNSLDNLDQAMDHLLNIRAELGVRLNSLDAQENINSGSLILLRNSLSKLEDVDYAKAINEMNIQLTALEAAQKIYIAVQDLSLFKFL